MKIAILINHNTASKFYCEILKKMGHIVYVPLFCSYENKTLQYEQVLNERNIEIDNNIKILDNFDFYKQDNDINVINNIYNIINDNFDIVITLHIINNTLNNLFLNSNKKIYYVVWGNETNNQFIGYNYINISNIPNKFFSIANKYLFDLIDKNDKYKYMPIGLPNMEKYFNTYNPTENTLIIIISRLSKFKYSNDYVHIYNYIVQLINSLPEYLIYICGKENETIKLTNGNVKFITFDTTDELYKNINKFKLNINISISDNILQYSSYECSCIGIPTLYKINSALDKTIKEYLHNDEYIFRYNEFTDLINKINIYMKMDKNILQNKFKIYRDIINNDKNIDNLITIWSNEVK